MRACHITVTVHNNLKCEIIIKLSLFENYLNYETIIINSGVLRNNSMTLNEFLQAAAYCLDPLSITMIESFEWFLLTTECGRSYLVRFSPKKK